jgi:predicted ATPase with chaperone activity
MIQERVLKARERQWQRLGSTKTNAEMNAQETSQFCTLDKNGEQLLRNIFNRQHLSARSHDRILRVARTIADLDGEKNILPRHLAESLQFRALDQNVLP